MLSIQELRQIQKFNYYNQEQENVFIFPSVCGLTSHIVENLLFRMNNIEQTTSLFLLDKRKITSNEERKGLFVPKDFGKSRSDVLANRFSGLTDVQVNSLTRMEVNTHEKIRQLTNTETPRNIFVIDTQTKNDKFSLNQIITQLKSAIHNPIHYIVVNNDDDNVYVNFLVIKPHDLSGEVVEVDEAEQTRTRGVNNAFMRNIVASQMVFNLVNQIVTNDITCNATKIEMNIKKDIELKSKLTYNIDLNDESVFKIIEPVVKKGKKELLALNSKFNQWLNTQNVEDMEKLVTLYKQKYITTSKFILGNSHDMTTLLPTISELILKDMEFELVSKKEMGNITDEQVFKDFYESFEINLEDTAYKLHNQWKKYNNLENLSADDVVDTLIKFSIFIKNI